MLEIAAQAQLQVALIGEQYAFARQELHHVGMHLLNQVVCHNMLMIRICHHLVLHAFSKATNVA
jgi:hypothetical protein